MIIRELFDALETVYSLATMNALDVEFDPNELDELDEALAFEARRQREALDIVYKFIESAK